MRLRLLIGLFFAAFVFAACQGGPPPTLFVMEVTREITVVVTADAGAQVAALGTPESTAEAESSITPTITPTTLPNVFPTPVVGQVYVAEQAFERGRALWLQPVAQIWLITTNEDGEQVWLVYDDTFEDGQVELDPSLTPPPGFYQPERGFGKLWRENPEVREILGWAIQSEFGYTTRYEYHAGGTVTADNRYVPGEGYHIIERLDRQITKFNEADRTWEQIRAN